MSGFVKPAGGLPTLTNADQLTSYMAKWRSALRPVLLRPTPPPPPFNFVAVSARGGVQLSWAPVNPQSALGKSTSGPDGYEILRSASGDFTSDLTVIPCPDPKQTTFFDSVGGGVKTFSYRIRTTAGTQASPKSVRGPDSGVLKSTSIDAADNVTAPVTTRDLYTSDITRGTANRGRYRNTYSNL